MSGAILGGTGLRARLLRSSGWVGAGFLAAQAVRLGSNLILTRILFPEAFGVMALLTVFLVGLTMLSDIGVGPAIQQSRRGDDPGFLDTAWTIQVARGGILWLSCFALGAAATWIYGDDRLQAMLPVAGLALLVAGFSPTRVETASRHLMLGRLTLLELVAQVLGLAATIALALSMQSVWALVLGHVATALIRLAVMQAFLPGPPNRLRWDRAAAAELIRFGKWIFLSTICGFVLVQGDKAILGKYLSVEMLGIYNIGFFLAQFPQAMAAKVMGQVMIPMHRERPPGASAENYAKIRRFRFAMTALVLAMQFGLALCGIWVIGLLYDDRFAVAGAVVVGVACMNVPHLIGMTYEFAALARGDSRGMFRVLLAKATAQTVLFVAGLELFGLPGGFAGLWLSQVLVHPLVVGLARRHGAWDPWHDLGFAAAGLAATVFVLWLHWDALLVLEAFTPAG